MKDNQSRDELLLQLHEQFSINQNDTFGKYISLFIALFALFAGYGIAFGLTTKLLKFGDYAISPVLFLFLSLFMIIVLSFLICLLIYNGYQHRRDQFLNGKIRKYFFIKEPSICAKKAEEQFEYFFNNYQGKSKSIFSFIPDNILINISFLGVLKLIILFCVFFVSSQAIACKQPIPNSEAISKSENTINQIQQSIVCSKCVNQADTVKASQNDILFAMIFSVIGILISFLFCGCIWLKFYKKYKQIEVIYNKEDLERLSKLHKEQPDSEIRQQIKNLILTILK